jgi:putative hydrolase of the HAD superfamily
VTWTGFPRGHALLFDLDDTLISDNTAVEECWQIACAEACEGSGREPGALRESIREVGGWYWSDPERHRVGRADLLAATVAIVREALLGLGADDEELARALAARYRRLREERQELLHGAVETLVALRRAGHRLALLTNGASGAQRAKLERFGLARHFEYIGIEGEVGVGKPKPEAFTRALAALAASAAQAWMIGDRLDFDVTGAKGVGIRAVWIDTAGAGLPPDHTPRPDHVIRSVRDLLTVASTGS